MAALVVFALAEILLTVTAGVGGALILIIVTAVAAGLYSGWLVRRKRHPRSGMGRL